MNRRRWLRVLAVLCCCGLEWPSRAPVALAQEAAPGLGAAEVPSIPAAVGGLGISGAALGGLGASGASLSGALPSAPGLPTVAGPSTALSVGAVRPARPSAAEAGRTASAASSPAGIVPAGPASISARAAAPVRNFGPASIAAAPVSGSRAAASAAPLRPPVSPARADAAPETLLPRVDLSVFAPESLNRLPDARVRSAGRELMDEVLGAASIRGKGDAVAAAPGRSAARPADAEPGDEAAAPRRNAEYTKEKDVYSAHRLSVFEWDPEEYVLNYLLGVEDPSPKGYELLVGLAAHKAKEALFSWIKAGRPAKDVALGQVMAEYDKAWKAGLAERSWKAKEGWRPSDYYNRGRRFIERRFLHMYPFDRVGEVVLAEEELRWTVTDPHGGKTYRFKGRPDLVTVKGDTLTIWDWKTYFNPPTLPQLLRDDYQLAQYVIALRQNHPELLNGRKVKLRWGYKEFDQEIDVDDAYLARVQERVLSLIHGIETLTRRFEAERGEWERRLRPQRHPKGLKEIKAEVDALGELRARERERRSELKGLRRRASELEDGLARFAAAKGLSEIAGKRAAAALEAKTTVGLPTKTNWPEEHEALVSLLKKEGVWDGYSKLHPASLRAAAEVQGGPDRALFDRIQGLLRSEHVDALEIERNEETDAPSRRGGGIASYKIARPSVGDDDAEPGVYSPHRLFAYLKDPKAYALKYIFRVKSAEPQSMDLLVGTAAHETLEEVFTLMKGGRPARDIRLAQVLELYRRKWAEQLNEGEWRPEPGLKAADHRKRGEKYLEKIWKEMYPFTNQGQIIYLERRMFYTLTDPETHKTYKFQGIPDRVMLEGETVVIRDWKTHWNPLTKKDVKEYSIQLGIYVRALQQLYPGLMAGRKVRLDLDTMHGIIRIDADESFLKDVDESVFKALRGIESLRSEVERDRAKWESLASSVGTPKTEAQAGEWVDELAGLKDRLEALEKEIKVISADQAEPEARVIAFARETGRPRVVGRDYTAVLRKKGSVTVPTKTLEVLTDTGKMRRVDNEDYAMLEAVLRESGAWDRYSELDYAALKRAMADPASPDRAVFERIKPLLRTESTVKVKLEAR